MPRRICLDNAHPINVANICYDAEREFDGLYDPA